MEAGQILILAILLFCVYLGWSLSRGRTGGVRLYVVPCAIGGSLLGAAGAQALGLGAAAEALNSAAIGLSLAALPSGGALWENEMRADLARTRTYQVARPADLLSWSAWLKLVDRVGARTAALGYLGGFAVAIGLALAATLRTRPDLEPGFALIALLAPSLFALLSAWWVYGAARRLVPGA